MPGRLTRIANHLVDRTDRDEMLDQSPLWTADKPLEDYFIDMRSKITALPLDSDERASALRAALPVALCQCAIGFHQEYHHGDAEALRWFLTCADILCDASPRDGVLAGGLAHDIPSPYRSRRPWLSAMAQGEALSVLARACLVCDDASKYEEAARLTVQPFFHSLAEGGVTNRDESGRVYLEEYPSDPPSHVLNGWVFALVGLGEYADAFDDAEAGLLAAESRVSLVAALPDYDKSYWSRYDLFPSFPKAFLANRFYHRLHIAQLSALHSMTGEPALQEHADRWARYLGSPLCRFRYELHRLAFKAACLVTGW